MESPDQSSTANDPAVKSSRAADIRTGPSRPRRHGPGRVVAREVAAVFLTVLFAGLLLERGLGPKPTASERYIGTTRVGSKDPSATIDGRIVLGYTFGPGDSSASKAPLDKLRDIRLGDAAVVKAEPAYELRAAVLDNRIRFGNPAGRDQLQTSAEQSERPGTPGQPRIQHFDAEKAVEQSRPKVQEPRPGGGDSISRDEKTTPEIIRSAVMVALLRAETLGLSSLEIDSAVLDSVGLARETTEPAILEGIRSVEDHLVSVRKVWLYNWNSVLSDTVAVKSYSILGKLANTPLAWPGGESFYMPHAIPTVGLPADTVSIFNPAYLVEAPTTPFASLLFLAGLFGAFFIRLRSVPRELLVVTPRGWYIAAVCVIATSGALYAMHLLWHAGPDRVFGSLPAVLSTALIAGVAVGASTGWWRTKLVREELGETRPDNVLRSVLHPDKPIENIEEDRLGFRPVVDALRRFLDNPGTTPPVVLSVNGPWGSGKSSVMKMLRTELGKTQRFRTVWFNAWRYHKEDQILAAFLKTITRDLRQDGWSARLAWVRLQRYSVWQYLLLLSPVAVVIAALSSESAAGLVKSVFQWLPMGEEAPEAEKTIVTTLGLGGTLVWLIRMAIPFQLQFRRLYATQDQSKRIGFLDEFAREFDLYREAVGHRKFVIFIDDLDRCPPDKIVDVLKTINLITTSGRAASTTFFVLGYDPKYITRSIELHFKEFTRAGTAIDRHFGAEYLKKMVTLSVSVPTPSADARTLLARRLGDAEDQTPTPVKHSWRDRTVLAARSIPGWLPKMAAAVSIAALVVVLAVRWQPPIDKKSAGPTSPSVVLPPSASNPSGVQFILSMKSVHAPAHDRIPWWAWTIPLVLVLASTGTLYIRSRPTKAEVKYVRQPEDTEEFVHAVEACKELLPENPRDVVRVLNLMRMQYLVQSIDSAAQEGAGGQPGGNGGVLNEWECVSYSVLQQRYPRAFSYRFVHTRLAPALRVNAHEPVSTFYNERREELDLPDGLAADIAALEETSWGVSHMGDPRKLDRYVQVNRYVLDAAGELIATDDETENAPAHAVPGPGEHAPTSA